MTAPVAPALAGLAALTAGLAFSGTARADDTRPRLTLRWTAPEGCPAGARVVAEVDRLLGDAGARPASPLDVRATVTPEPAGGLRVRVETDRQGATRVRELRASSCEALADATAVILALMIDPAAVAVAPPRPTTAPAAPRANKSAPPTPPFAVTPPAPPFAATPPAPLPAAISPAPRPNREVRFHVGPWALADAGTLPRVSFAAGGAAGVSIGALRLELGGGAWPARAAVIAARPSAGGDVSLVAGSAGACYDVLGRAPFTLGPCAAMEVGRLHAAGFGVTAPGAGSSLWSAARAGGLFTWAPARRFAFTLRVEGVVPFARPTFVLQNVGAVYRAGAVAGRAGGGVELRF